jgi:pimeloyl-ACP methyl ester carboxylesterase
MGQRGGVIQLEGGRHLRFDEYGDPNGIPVLFLHGWPSSRSMAQLTATAAAELGIRVISPDRPGINESAFEPGRTLLHWAPIVRAIAEQLEVPRFHLLAISGGAPYAYATAQALPELVSAIAVASGAPPIAELKDHGGLLQLHRWMLALHARRPDLLRVLFRLARPFALLRPPIRIRPMLLKLLQPCDAEVLRETAAFDAFFESTRRAWRGSALGVMTDAEVYARPWGFSLEEIRAPVRLWHGMKDRTFSFRLAQEVSERLPNCRLQLVPDAGHYSLPIRHIHAILADLISV